MHATHSTAMVGAPSSACATKSLNVNPAGLHETITATVTTANVC